MFRRLTITVREWVFTLRAWLNDWFELLTGPVRAVRAFRPLEFAAELFSGGKEALSLGRTSVRIAAGTLVGFIAFLVWLPLHSVRFGKWSVLYAWWWLRTRT